MNLDEITQDYTGNEASDRSHQQLLYDLCTLDNYYIEVLVNLTKSRWIAEIMQKTNHVDATKLAQLLHVDMVAGKLRFFLNLFPSTRAGVDAIIVRDI
ncbi:hypothetical protein [Haladaptatus halobius]|uniref:hypothetical protein n=1 Tax=Haladaptatus halobius TaxID=2884875 RepID=UPI001D0A398C|nr:hypothetical protein [Haladaptatus halobius]